MFINVKWILLQSLKAHMSCEAYGCGRWQDFLISLQQITLYIAGEKKKVEWKIISTSYFVFSQWFIDWYSFHQKCWTWNIYIHFARLFPIECWAMMPTILRKKLFTINLMFVFISFKGFFASTCYFRHYQPKIENWRLVSRFYLLGSHSIIVVLIHSHAAMLILIDRTKF